jgi:hypothetical protein
MAAEIAKEIGLIQDAASLRVTLDNERSVLVSLMFFPRLREGTPEQRRNCRLIGSGEGIHWPDLDEDISVPSLLNGGRPVVQIGPLTTKLIAGAKWRYADAFPAPQVYANDVEAVLEFLQSVNRREAFVAKVQKENRPGKRDNLLAEARAAFWLGQNGLQITGWEPEGEGGKTGEFSCTFESSPTIFVEVKQPGWQSELMPSRSSERRRLTEEEKRRRLARKEQGKFILGQAEGGAVGSHAAAMDVVRRNVLPKLTENCPNLAIVVDDFHFSPVGLPNLSTFVEREFSCPAHDPEDAEDRFSYERLGGVLFLNVQAMNGQPVDYLVKYVPNPGVIAACALPPSVNSLFDRLSGEAMIRDKASWIGSGFTQHIKDGTLGAS